MGVIRDFCFDADGSLVRLGYIQYCQLLQKQCGGALRRTCSETQYLLRSVFV